jgi:ribosomal-protein-alanine N-acetyltransferase
MSETLKTMLTFAFEQFGLHSISANVNPNNESSIRLLEKNNFVQEAYFKEDYFFDGKYIDSLIFSLLEPK